MVNHSQCYGGNRDNWYLVSRAELLLPSLLNTVSVQQAGSGYYYQILATQVPFRV